ncbi:hypothetical protein EVAR_82424_1 [Eumeta japonica]|uniref:Uncharacterized protein n=1 Tax=Eumeta variegata TaxID=151549 RepID=A0A4C1YFS7_EUMVA|nr:hypothetical protein EVAR_82424_1 [Eumeta japonica]
MCRRASRCSAADRYARCIGVASRRRSRARLCGPPPPLLVSRRSTAARGARRAGAATAVHATCATYTRSACTSYNTTAGHHLADKTDIPSGTKNINKSLYHCARNN